MLNLLGSFFVWTVVAVLGFIVVDFAIQYKTAVGTRNERCMAAFRHAETIVVARLTQLGGALALVVPKLADFAGMPQVGDFIRAWLSDPVYVAGAFVVLGILVEVARKYKATDI